MATGETIAHFMRGAGGEWQQVTRFDDGVKRAKLGRDNALYLLSKQDAPRGKILRFPLADTELRQATLIVPESKGVVEELRSLRQRPVREPACSAGRRNCYISSRRRARAKYPSCPSPPSPDFNPGTATNCCLPT